MLPDAVTMLSSVPEAMHISVQDVNGVWHDAVQTALASSPSVSEYGIHNSTDTDDVYVALPVELPKSRLTIRNADGAIVVRRIVGRTNNIVFVTLTVGDICG